MKTVIDNFNASVATLGDKVCLKYKEQGKWIDISWNQASTIIDSYAKGLVALGAKKGGSVGLLSRTRYEWTLIDMAILKIGAVTIPIYPSSSAANMLHVLNETETEVLFVENEDSLSKIESIKDELKSLRRIVVIENINKQDTLTLYLLSELGKGIEKLPEPPTEDDTASIIYTSGTTGTPRGAIITHKNIMGEVDGLRRSFTLVSDDIMFSFLPLAHVLARAVQFYQLCEGCQVAYAESIEKIAQNLKEVRPHMTVVVPRFLEKIYDKIDERLSNGPTLKRSFFEWSLGIGAEYNQHKLRREKIATPLKVKHLLAEKISYSKVQKELGGRIKFIVTGGAPLAAELAKKFYNLGIMIIEGYGLTETLAAICVNRLDDFHFGTVGKPVHGAQVKLAHDNEILLKGEMVFKGYFKREDETREAFDKDGWFKSGDIGEFSKDGFLRITDRKKDILVTSGGKNIAPQFLESVLQENKYISHAVVFGDRRKYIAALLSLNADEIKRFADLKKIQYKDYKELVERPEIRELISSVISEKNKGLSQFESIKKFAILDRDFTIEDGELTPTLKVKRRLIEERYKDIIEGLYVNGSG